MTTVVFTATIGSDTDAVRPPLVIDPGVRYVVFSDRPCHVEPYEWVPIPTTDRPRVAARRLKILADHPALRGADAIVWHDASYQLHRTPGWAARGLRHADLLALRHPRRDSIDAEAIAIVRYGYLSGGLARQHVARYRAEGFREQSLTCTGLLARRASPSMQRFNARWWEEAQQWGGRDQASVDYAAWREGVRIRHLLGTIKANRYAGWRLTASAPAQVSA